MTEQQKIDINAEIKGITIPKLYLYAFSSIGVLFTLFMMYSDIKEDLALIKQSQEEYKRRIEKIETKIGL